MTSSRSELLVCLVRISRPLYALPINTHTSHRACLAREILRFKVTVATYLTAFSLKALSIHIFEVDMMKILLAYACVGQVRVEQ